MFACMGVLKTGVVVVILLSFGHYVIIHPLVIGSDTNGGWVSVFYIGILYIGRYL